MNTFFMALRGFAFKKNVDLLQCVFHDLLHFIERKIQCFPFCDKNKISVLSDTGEHSRKTGFQPAFTAVALHRVPNFFGYRKSDLQPLFTVTGRNKGKAIRADPFSGSVGIPKFFMPF